MDQDSTFATLNGTPAPVENAPAHPLLEALSAGKLPGLNVPKGYQPKDAALNDITIEHIKAAGLALYRPHDPNLLFSVFNPNKVDPENVKQADAKGELNKLFPSLDQLDGATPPTGPVGLAGQTPAASTPQVPVQPRAASAKLPPSPAGVSPTERPIPVGGQLLNQLVRPRV